MPSGRDIDPRAETLAAATAGAELAARTLSEGLTTRPRAAPSDELIGKHLAHFRIERRIGRGGMGEVYLATDLALDRPVAVKLLGGEINDDPAARARFVREARAQARINHPNICHIYFIGEQDGRIFFAMEYVEGENLQQRLERDGKVPHPEAVELVRMAAAGLAEAQRHGFIHRDIKPSNLLVDRNGVLKVADFGLVKEPATSDGAETGGAAIVGTPLYMAPEQARGESLDFRADMYALGVTLHQLVAGAPPFAGDSALAIVSKHLTASRPRFDAATARHTALVDALCDRLMAKQPSARFASYDELRGALDDASPRLTRPGGGWPRAFALLLDLIIVGIATGLIEAVPYNLGVELPSPLLFIAAVYSVTAHAIWGRTYGKRAFELVIVSEERRRGIGWRRALARWSAQWLVPYCLIGVVYVLEHFHLADAREAVRVGVGVVLSVAAALWLIVLGIMAERSAGKRALWDRVAGTRVVYTRA